jgi:hypothetical protein
LRKAILAALAGAFALCSSSVEAQQDPLAAVNMLLERRTAAVRNGDSAAFLATVDPRAPAAFREAQARSFDGLRTVPLASFTLRARTEDSGDLAASASAFLPETRATYRFEGYDAADMVDTLYLTYVERDGKWYVASDTDLDDLGLLSTRNVWDNGPIETRRGEHVAVVSHPAQGDRAQALLGLGDEAMGVLATRWDQPWPGRIPIVLPDSPDELGRAIQATFDVSKFVAFVAYAPVRDDGYVNTAPRMFIQDRNLSRYGHQFQLETLVHELGHAAVAPYAGPAIPAWVHEGIADWVALGRPTGERRPAGSDGVLPRDYEFTSGSSAEILRSYQESRSAISYLASRFGLGAPTKLIKALGDLGTPPGSVDHNVDATLRRLFGISLQELQQGWKSR